MAGVQNMMFNIAPVRVLTTTLAFFGSSGTTAPVGVYTWIPDTGWGTKLADGSSTTAIVGGDAMRTNNAGTMLGVVSQNTPFIHVFPITSAGIGTKFANPVTLPPGQGRQVGFSPDDNNVALAGASTPQVSAYPISPSGFGTRYANPSPALPTGTQSGAQWTPAGNEIAFSGSTAPRVQVYNWNNGYGTRQTNSYTEASIAFQAGSWNTNGTKFVTGGGAAANYGPLVFEHAVGSGFSSYSAPATQIPNTVNAVRFNPTNTAMSAGHSTTPFMSAYQWNNSSGLGTKYGNPAALPPNQGTTLPFSVSGTDLIVSAVTLVPMAYKWTDASGFGTRYSNGSPAMSSSFRGGALQGFYS